ncbi:hypothetical protein BGZ58_005424, partial [Dissophora ornata]
PPRDEGKPSRKTLKSRAAIQKLVDEAVEYIVQDLAGGDRVEGASAQEQTGQGNIRRRLYDALNILEALGTISMDKKEIRWISIQNVMPIWEDSRRVQLTNPGVSLQSLQERERDGADESEELEDDDMEIE